ncbi:hypothetical protein SAMN06265337_4193 [Hymenobacter gelipurpurascens]|uniref:SpoIIAA-like n=1 Tax=Hymenobacter gelipurpurascens TaxID=89968 RepID=A0A212UH71_9BACT|nr:hypothetical protein [Hymenobacter gelipurpurascens]SNC77599.1 hypothetical protein SAMN06265337_4193 [Hymenobacter gelipurpurascens]
MPLELTNPLGNKYLSTRYDSDNQWVYNDWIGYQTFDSVFDGAEACLQLLQKHSCSYLLNDNRRVLGRWDHSMLWVLTDWVPRAIEVGLTHFAHVVQPDAMAMLSAEALTRGVGKGLQVVLFDDMEKAKSWLREAQQAAAS